MPHFYPPDPAPVNQIPREFCCSPQIALGLGPESGSDFLVLLGRTISGRGALKTRPYRAALSPNYADNAAQIRLISPRL